MKKVQSVEVRLLCDRVEYLRKDKNLTMRQFAELCGISKTQANDLANGGVDFRYSTLVKISKGLEMTVSELINY